MTTLRARRSSWPILAAAILCAAALALFWPGFASYDTVVQFKQVLSGAYDDWHPPAMARLWAVLHAALGGGQAPLLVLQMGLYWLGFGLIATRLTRLGRRIGAVATLAIAACPLFLGWQGVVLKDAQLLAALLASVGLVAWWRLAGRQLPAMPRVAVALLLLYATLVRANAVFATVPLIVMLWHARPWQRIASGLAMMAAIILLSPLVNHRLLNAAPSGVERAQPLFDLAGIAAHGGPDALAPAETQALLARHCYQPFFWDSLGTRCGEALEGVHWQPEPALMRQWAAAVLHHPLAYAAHRVAHLNSTDRWLVPAGWPAAIPIGGGEPNSIGLAKPSATATGFQRLGGWVSATPIGWPIAWITVAMAAGLASMSLPASPTRDLARALLVSALCLEASFVVVSIASDLRYHLWSMVATALALPLLAGAGRADRRVLRAGGAALLLVLAAGYAARLTLPDAKNSYASML